MKRFDDSNSSRASRSIRVRAVKVSDFGFVRRLAAKKVNFTVPPPYVLWLLRQTNSACCMVAEHHKFGRVGYLLSVLVGTPKGKALYVWQLATSQKGMTVGAIQELLLSLRAFMRRTQVQRVFFTAVPHSPEVRAIRRYAYSLFGTELRARKPLPTSVSHVEHEFMVKIK